MICQRCGLEVPTRYVSFSWIVGAIVVSWEKEIEGRFCKTCIRKLFWEYTPCMLLGWGSPKSFFFTPFYILGNVLSYWRSCGLEDVPPDAHVVRLDDRAIGALGPHTKLLVDRINEHEPLEKIAADIALHAEVTPGQVVLYVAMLCEQAKQSRIAGFPTWDARECTAVPVNKVSGRMDPRVRDFRILGIPISLGRSRQKS